MRQKKMKFTRAQEREVARLIADARVAAYVAAYSNGFNKGVADTRVKNQLSVRRNEELQLIKQLFSIAGQTLEPLARCLSIYIDSPTYDRSNSANYEEPPK